MSLAVPSCSSVASSTVSTASVRWRIDSASRLRCSETNGCDSLTCSAPPLGAAPGSVLRTRSALRSSALVLRLALLGEGPRALLRVLRREDLPADRVLDRHGLGLGHVLGLAPGPQDRLGRQRAARGDLLGDRLRGVERGAVGHDPADETDLLRLDRADRLRAE